MGFSSVFKGLNLTVLKVNPLNAELNPICHLLTLLAHHFFHVSGVRVKYQRIHYIKHSLLESDGVRFSRNIRTV